MKKNFVFDTNVLLIDPHAVFKFEDNNIVIPITVLEELDKFKRDLNSLGRNAREVARLLDGFRSQGNLNKGVTLESGGTLRVLTDLGKEPPLPFPTLGKTADSLILAAALLLEKREDLPVIFVTRDINLRLRADAVGLKAENYEEDEVVEIEEMYSGRTDVEVSSQDFNMFMRESTMKCVGKEVLPNQFVTLVDESDPSHVTDGRCHGANGEVRAIIKEETQMWGIKARNMEQRYAMDLLLDDKVQVVTLAGKAGTGKTLLAIAAGLKKVVDENKYSKLVVARPIMPLGKELGFLPGELGEKLGPWMEPVFDNLELIAGLSSGKTVDTEDRSYGYKKKRHQKRTGGVIDQLLETGLLEVQALTYIRGRSLPKQFLIIDEAQNLTHHEVKTIITRAGEGTKVVLTGDPYQIDSPFLEASTSGLTIVVERFKGQKLAGHVTLVKGERSPLAELASNIL